MHILVHIWYYCSATPQHVCTFNKHHNTGVDTGFVLLRGGGGDATRVKMGVSVFTSIGMINLTMVVNSTNIIMKFDRDFRIIIL